MLTLKALDKLIVTRANKRQNARVIGVKPESNGTTTYMLEPLRVDFRSFTNGSRMMRINTHDIETKAVSIEKHTI